MPDMLIVLREATGPSHERLDASFGALDLQTREGIGQFLAAHAAGLDPMFPAFRAFIEGELGLECPDYPAMLRADLDALGIAAPPTIEPAPGLDVAGGEAGIAYVVSGSRLGLVVIRQRGYWGEGKGFRSAYMSDGRGHDAWKALVPVLRTRTYAPEQAEALRTAALAAFETFSRAFAASNGLKARVDG
ncbi:biliverdin-producing heme oxygenase [Novosphingobium guangzhouense]|uniref:Heme oxygenase n=1 Tax=Novosphingobium guangzhouense TaxID=1850347 RepID=A0A2K2FTD4_9SPHN|nr:biliverdin-producing heme oxygenase [Novosphingobium guangzhouense]PNU02031.1 heme oxygenase [Novosphingobium guangzhouense]